MLSESGVEGRSRFRYSASVSFRGIVNGLPGSGGGFSGDDDILVSMRGDSIDSPELSLVSR